MIGLYQNFFFSSDTIYAQKSSQNVVKDTQMFFSDSVAGQ